MTHISELLDRARANAGVPQANADLFDAEEARARSEAFKDHRERLHRISLIPERFEATRLADVRRERGNSKALDAAQEVLDSGFSEGVALFGTDVGCGKTSIGAALCNEAISRGICARMLTSVTLLDRMREAVKFSSPDDVSEIVGEFALTPVLMLDDLGKEPVSHQGLSWLHELLDRRWAMAKPIVLTTNFTFEGLVKRYEVACERANEPLSKADAITDRIIGMVPRHRWVQVSGKSRRGNA